MISATWPCKVEGNWRYLYLPSACRLPAICRRALIEGDASLGRHRTAAGKFRSFAFARSNRSTHRTAETAKAILRHYYGTTEKRSYFSGCSNGGRQGLMEAQRFPNDFDGIVVGAPVHDFVGLAAQFVKDMQAVFPDPRNLSTPMFTPETLKSVDAQIVEKCDAVDGVKDGLLEDPRRCNIDVAGLAGLSNRQRAALKKIYAETSGKAGAICPARPVGGEGEVDSWPAWITGGSRYAAPQVPSLGFAVATHFFKFFVFNDPSWDYSDYDLANARKDARLAATFMNATNPDLDAFKAKGRKLIVWHGWSDAAPTALSSINYFEEVRKRDDGVRDYFRLFLMPGVLHCGGGPGPGTVDWPGTIADWVENGKPPDQVIARTSGASSAVSRARPLCPYPQHAGVHGQRQHGRRGELRLPLATRCGAELRESFNQTGNRDERAAVRFLSAGAASTNRR